jgi:DNA-binding transcriptional MocR family regulator
MLTMVNSSGYVERVVNDLIVSGQYRDTSRDCVTGLKAPRQRRSLNLGIGVFGAPRGGYHVWSELPSEIDEIELAKRAAEESIFLAPGSIFCPDRKTVVPAMRVNIAYGQDPRFGTFYKNYLKKHGKDGRVS